MKRICLDCGSLTTTTRCPPCTRRRDATRRPSADERYGPGRKRRHAALYGLPCALQRPGCTGWATTAEHTVPVSRGGILSPLVPARGHCNASKGNRDG